MTQIAIPFAKTDHGRKGLRGLPTSGPALLPRLLVDGIACSSPSDNVRMLEAAAIYRRSKREFVQIRLSKKLVKAWTKRNNELQRMATKNTKYIREILPAYFVATALAGGYDALIGKFIDGGVLTEAAVEVLKNGSTDLGLVRAYAPSLPIATDKTSYAGEAAMPKSDANTEHAHRGPVIDVNVMDQNEARAFLRETAGTDLLASNRPHNPVELDGRIIAMEARVKQREAISQERRRKLLSSLES